MIWVSDKTEFILKKALFNFASKLAAPASKVQLVITTYDEKEKTPAFRVLLGGNPARIDHGEGSADEHVTLLEVLDVPLVVEIPVESKDSLAVNPVSAFSTWFSGSFIQETLEAILFDDVFPAPDSSWINTKDFGCFIPSNAVMFCFLKDFLNLHDPLPSGWGIPEFHSLSP